MDFDETIRKRASIKNYSLKKPPIEKIIEVIEAANLAPSPGNLEMVKFIIVENTETIKKISEACQQRFIEKAPFIVVICSNPKRVKIMYDERAETYIKQHVGALGENFLLKTTDLGLASSWVWAFSDITIRDLLKIPEDINIEAILPIGHQSKIDKTKQRKKHSLNNRVFFETYSNKYQKPLIKLGEH